MKASKARVGRVDVRSPEGPTGVSVAALAVGFGGPRPVAPTQFLTVSLVGCWAPMGRNLGCGSFRTQGRWRLICGPSTFLERVGAGLDRVSVVEGVVGLTAANPVPESVLASQVSLVRLGEVSDLGLIIYPSA